MLVLARQCNEKRCVEDKKKLIDDENRIQAANDRLKIEQDELNSQVAAASQKLQVLPVVAVLCQLVELTNWTIVLFCIQVLNSGRAEDEGQLLETLKIVERERLAVRQAHQDAEAALHPNSSTTGLEPEDLMERSNAGEPAICCAQATSMLALDQTMCLKLSLIVI